MPAKWRLKKSLCNRKLTVWLWATLVLSLEQSSFGLAPPKIVELSIISAHAADNPDFGNIGIQLVYAKDTGMFISLVSTGSPAERAGLRIGDKIESVNGVQVNALSGSKITNLLQSPIGTKVSLKIVRNGQPESFTVTSDNSYSQGDFERDSYIQQLLANSDYRERQNNQTGRFSEPFRRNLIFMVSAPAAVMQQSYFNGRWNDTLFQIHCFQYSQDAKTFLNSKYWPTGKTLAEKATESTIPILFNTLDSLGSRNHYEFLVNLNRLSETSRRTPWKDQVAIGAWIIGTCSNRTQKWARFLGPPLESV